MNKKYRAAELINTQIALAKSTIDPIDMDAEWEMWDELVETNETLGQVMTAMSEWTSRGNVIAKNETALIVERAQVRKGDERKSIVVIELEGQCYWHVCK